jgi:hypothetical protein
MKRIILFAMCALFVFAVKAQTSKDEVSLLQSLYGMGKKDLVISHMKITPAESEAFWKIYDEYEVSRKAIGTRRANNIISYADAYANLSNEKATELVKSSVAINSDFIKLQEKTFKKLAKVMTPVRAAQFVQMEMYLENILRVNLSDEIPLIGEFKANQK